MYSIQDAKAKLLDKKSERMFELHSQALLNPVSDEG